MTPMTEFGVHAVGGNWFGGGKHRSIGIEVIGYYEKQHWPPAVERLVASAVNTLMNRLGTFELRYLYPNGSPISFKIGEVVHYQHPDRLTFGGICAHRDFNKPMCPGGAISSDYYIGVLKAGADDGVVMPVVQSADPLTLDSPLIGRVSGSQEAAARYLTARLTPASEYNQNDVASIVGSYWQHATAAGVDPLVALAQCALETKNLSSFWSQRPRRNPAGLGVPDQNNHDVGRYRLTLTLTNHSRRNPLADEVTMRLLRQEADQSWAEVAPDSGGQIVFGEGDRVALEVANKGNRPVWLNILDFGLSGAISVLYPFGTQHEPLPPGETLQLGTGDDFVMSLALPPNFSFSPAGGVETFKLFVTSAPADFRPLVQEGVRDPAQKAPLWRLLGMAITGSGTRGAIKSALPAADDWLTLECPFVLQPRP